MTYRQIIDKLKAEGVSIDVIIDTMILRRKYNGKIVRIQDELQKQMGVSS
jgi:hypothetical protein